MTTGVGEDVAGVELGAVTGTIGTVVGSAAEQLALLQISLSGITVML